MQDNADNGKEIDLIDLFRIIWKRKSLIILGTLLFTLAGTGLAFYLPKVFEVTAIFEPGSQLRLDENGRFVKEKLLLEPIAIREIILSGAYNQIIRTKRNIPGGNFPQIKVSNPRDTSMVKLVIESTDPQGAVMVLEDVVQLVGEAMQEKAAVQKQMLQNEISLATIERRTAMEMVALSKEQVLETRKIIHNLVAEKKKVMTNGVDGAMAILLYSNEVQDKQGYLNQLQEKVKGLESAVLINETKLGNLKYFMDDFKVLTVFKNPSVPGKPISPKKVLIVALSFIFGIMGSTMLVFLIEYVRNNAND